MGLKLSRVDTKTIRFLEGSKLKDKEVTFRGLNQMSYFTVQCWALQLLYFIGSAACYVLSLRAAPISSVLLKRVLPAACWCATATRTDAPTHQPLRVIPGPCTTTAYKATARRGTVCRDAYPLRHRCGPLQVCVRGLLLPRLPRQRCRYLRADPRGAGRGARPHPVLHHGGSDDA